MKNPFDPQNPTDPQYFYGRTDVINRFHENIEYGLSGSPEHIGLIGDFGIGKTSLLNKLYSIDTPENVRSIYLQLNVEDVDRFHDFIKIIVEKLSKDMAGLDIGFELKNIDLEILKLEKKEREATVSNCINDLEQLFEKCGDGEHLVILFLDDLHLAGHHMNDIRNCFQELNRRGCNFMLVATLIPELFEEGEINRPFKRMFNQNHLEEFSRDEANEMVEHIINAAGMDLVLSAKLKHRLYNETGGHPYYLTLFMNELLRERNSGKISIGDYERREPKIIDRLKVVLDGKFSSMTENDEEIIRRIIEVSSGEFSPSDASASSSQFRQLQNKDVLEKIGHGRYKFKYPIVRRYFQYKEAQRLPR